MDTWPIRLEGLIQRWSQGWNNHWGHTVQTLLGQLVLGKKAGCWYKDTFDQSNWCLMFLFCQAWISLLRLPEPSVKRKTILKVIASVKEASLRGSNGALPIGAMPGEVPGGDAPPTRRSVSVNCSRDERDSHCADI